MSARSPQPTGLIFNWEKKLRMQPMLPVFFMVAVVFHALSFYLFRISYPPVVSMRPPSAEVRILLPDSPENAALLARIALDDPALPVRGSNRYADLSESSLTVPYVASFESRHIRPLNAPQGELEHRLPPAVKSLPVKRLTAQKAMETPRLPATGSTIQFDEALASFATALPPMPAYLKADGARGLARGEYLVAVDETGVVRSVFLQTSSGSKEADELGDAWLRRCLFQGGSASLRWGVASVRWGSDVYGPRP
jgi:hypothetical protein